MKRLTHYLPGRNSTRRGFTLVEVTIASALAAMGSIMVVTYSMQIGKWEKGIFTQQQSLHNAKNAIEHINEQVRLAVTPLTVLNAANQAAVQGNKVRFTNTAGVTGEIRLTTADGDFMTPWDNTLVLDPNINAGGDERVIARGIAPSSAAGAFRYTGATSSLQVNMRTGDQANLTGTAKLNADAHTGMGTQGFEINMTVAPRN